MGNQSAKIVASVVTLSLLLNAGLAYASDNQAGAEQEVIVMYKNEEGKEKILDESVEVDHQFETIPAVSATVTNADLYELVTDPNIAHIERNVPVYVTGDFKVASTIPAEQSQWNFQAVQPTKMWAEGWTGTGVKVAVIDTGIFAHSELSIAGGISTVDYTTSYSDDDGHGTHVAGIIAAKNNGTGLVGVAPDVELYAVKAIKQNGEGSLQDVLEGIEWAIQNDMDIINISLGMDTDSSLLHEMVDRAYDAGIVVVGSAGNSQEGIPTSTYTVNYPAKYDSVIAVAAVNNANVRGVFSSIGPEVELAAPGVDVISTYVTSDGTGGYAKANGTSQAAPHVAGMIALLMQKNPSMSNAQLREEVRKYAVDIGVTGRDTEFGFGSVTFNKDVTAPADVTNIQVTGKTENSISLAWVNPTDTDFATNNIYANDVKVGTTADESFTLNALQPSTSYTIAVKSVDAGGNESTGATVTETTNADATAPAEVSNLTLVEKSATTAKFSWTNPVDSDFSKVNLYNNGTLAGNIAGTEFEFTGLTPNTNYTFEFKTVDGVGNESTGQSMAVTTDEDTTPPAEVTGLTIGEVTTTTAEINWSNPSDTDFAKVNLYLNGTLVGDTTGTSYVFTGLTPNTNYVLQVKTVDATGNISAGRYVMTKTEAELVVDTTPPAEVGNLIVSNATENSLEISWNNPSDPDFGHVQVYVDGNLAQTITGDVYQATGLSPNTSYTFLVKTVDEEGNESAGRTITGTTSAVVQPPVDNIPPAEVSDLTVVDKTTNTVDVSWTNPSDPDFAKAYLYVNGVKVQETTGTSYVFNGLAPDTIYEIEVKTVDSNGNVSVGRSISVRTEVEPIVTPPVDVTAPAEVSDLEVASVTETTLRVRWVNPIDSDYAKAKVYLEGNFVADTSNSYYEFSGLTADTAYTIVIKTVDISGNVSTGTTIAGKTQATVVTPPTDPADPTDPQPPVVDLTPPGEVTGLVADTTTATSIIARWNNPADVDFAKVKLFINGNYIAESIGSSYEFTGLVADTAYSIVVKTVDASGNVSTGTMLAARTQVAPVVTPPTTPTNPTEPSIPGEDIVELPTNPTPAPGGNSGGGGSSRITLPSTVEEKATAALEKAKDSLTIVDFVGAKSAILALTDEEKREEFTKELITLKQELKIKELPTKNVIRTTVPVGISLEVAMKSANYKYIDESSIRDNVFILNSKGELLRDVRIQVIFNRIFIEPPLNGRFPSKETYTIIIDTAVKGKASLDSAESFELTNPLMLEFTTR